MAPSIKSAKGELNLATEKITSTIEADVTDKIKFKAVHKQDTGILSAELKASHFKMIYYPPKNNLVVGVENKFDGFGVKILQELPNLEVPLVPSPIVQIDTQLVKREGLSDGVELKYDMRTRLAAIKQKFKIKESHECSWAIDSKEALKGAKVSWKTKFKKPYAKSLSASYSNNMGPVLEYEVQPTDRTELELKAIAKTQTLKGEIMYKPEELNSAEIGLSLSRSLQQDKKCEAIVCCKWKF